MDTKKATMNKKKLIIAASIIVVLVAVLQIPVVKDVIGMTRMGMISRITDMEKVEYEGEKYWQFTFRKLDEEAGATMAIVVEHSLSKVTIKMWEPLTGKVGYVTKPLFGEIYQESSEEYLP